MPEAKGPVYDDYQDILHRHYDQNYDDGRYPFERYEVAYSWGFNLAADEAYSTRDWLEIEEDVREEWQRREAEPWEEFKEAIRHAFNLGKEAHEE